MSQFFSRCNECGLTGGVHAFGCPVYDEWLDLVRAEIQRWNPIPAAQRASPLAFEVNPEPEYEPAPFDPARYLRDYPECYNAPEPEPEPTPDAINPSHYRAHPSGVECIQITEHMGFNLGNAVKYIWRADLKHESPLDDLHKAAWYIAREIERRGKVPANLADLFPDIAPAETPFNRGRE